MTKSQKAEKNPKAEKVRKLDVNTWVDMTR